jgi:hypothetical protein
MMGRHDLQCTWSDARMLQPEGFYLNPYYPNPYFTLTLITLTLYPNPYF